MLSECPRYAAYSNPKWKWIVAASGYNVVEHYPADGQISTFEVPADLGSGKYILHWWWRGAISALCCLAPRCSKYSLCGLIGYYNCIDIDVVDQKTRGTVKHIGLSQQI